MRHSRLPQVGTWAGSARFYSSFVAIKKGEDAAWTAAAQHRKQVIELDEGRLRRISRHNQMGGKDAFRKILSGPGNTAKPQSARRQSARGQHIAARADQAAGED